MNPQINQKTEQVLFAFKILLFFSSFYFFGCYCLLFFVGFLFSFQFFLNSQEQQDANADSKAHFPP